MNPISLNDNELEALRILWECGELKPAAIQAKFSWPIENATLRSVLVKLVEEEHATRRLQGKAFLYAARLPKHALLGNLMRRLAQVFAGGSAQELVAQMVKTADIKPGDIELLRQTAAETSKREPRKNKRRTP
jgi:BlaI family transcriptional regulator, penicillinase repressor